MTQLSHIPFHVDMSRVIDLLAKQIYQTPLALLRENAQNAYDAILVRRQFGTPFEAEIVVDVAPTMISVKDNGVGMTLEDLSQHYWRAGSSGKNTAEARAAGVVGTFGIGAMANFGIADELVLVTESAVTGARTRSRAGKATLSATQECIELQSEPSTGCPGTTIVATIPPSANLNVQAAIAYLRECVEFLDVPVLVNGVLVSQRQFSDSTARPPQEWAFSETGVSLGQQFTADIEMILPKVPDVWVQLANITCRGVAGDGTAILRQGAHHLRTFRSRFALAGAAVRSVYGLGGVINLRAFEPTAGREALTTESLQLLQDLVSEVEAYISIKMASTPAADQNTCFMEWVQQNNKHDLCGLLKMRVEPHGESILLQDVRTRTQDVTMSCFDGTDPQLIEQYASEEHPLLVVATRQPRRRCEQAYLSAFCRVTKVVNTPQVVSPKPQKDWTLAESGFAFRMGSILETDYFVPAAVSFGTISHRLPLFVDTSQRPVEVVLDPAGSTLSAILKLYDTDYAALTGMAKDFVRTLVFPKISDLVPSSTRQGAEAFLKAIRRPREVFEYEKADLGSFSEIWSKYLQGEITLGQAAEQSAEVARASIQVLEPSGAGRVASVVQDVLDNEKIMENAESKAGNDALGPLPAITRLDRESTCKLLTIGENETPLKGYRCFIALSNRVREERGDFFLQPHRTEIVWGGQKAFYIFQHHSGEFGLYYELQGSEVFAGTPGGKAIPTCTIVVKNQVYIPVPDDIRLQFIPTEGGKKRFEIRCELLYPEAIRKKE
jgi:molecular chaperone HtpG